VIIGILALLLFLCLIFYLARVCTRRKNEKPNDPELAPMIVQQEKLIKDLKGGDTLPLINGINESKKNDSISISKQDMTDNGSDTVDKDAGDKILDTIREIESKTTSKIDKAKDLEAIAIAEKSRELELLLQPSNDDDSELVATEETMRKKPILLRSSNIDTAEGPNENRKSDTMEVDPVPFLLAEENEKEAENENENLWSGDSPSPRESLNSQIEESLNQIINSLNESTTANNPDAPDLNSLNVSISANIPALKANVDTKDDEAKEPIENFNETAKIVDRRHENEKENNFKADLVKSEIEIPMPMTLTLSPKMDKGFSSSHFEQTSNPSTPVGLEKPFQAELVELKVNVFEAVRQISAEETPFTLSSPGLVLNSSNDFRPTPEVRVAPRVDPRPPKAPRTNPRSKATIEAQTDKPTRELTLVRTRSNSMDAGTQTPRIERKFDFEVDMSGSDSDQSIDRKSKKEGLEEEIAKLKEEMADVRKRLNSTDNSEQNPADNRAQFAPRTPNNSWSSNNNILNNEKPTSPLDKA